MAASVAAPGPLITQNRLSLTSRLLLGLFASGFLSDSGVAGWHLPEWAFTHPRKVESGIRLFIQIRQHSFARFPIENTVILSKFRNSVPMAWRQDNTMEPYFLAKGLYYVCDSAHRFYAVKDSAAPAYGTLHCARTGPVFCRAGRRRGGQMCSPRWCLTQDSGAFDAGVCALGPRWVFLYRARRSGCSRPNKSSTRFATLQVQSNLCSTWFGATCASQKILEPREVFAQPCICFCLVSFSFHDRSIVWILILDAGCTPSACLCGILLCHRYRQQQRQQ